MAISAFPISSPLRIDTNSYIASSSPIPPSFSVSSKSSNRLSTIVLCSNYSGNGVMKEDETALFEGYGLDPNDFLSARSPKAGQRKRKRRLEGNKALKKWLRATHRLLQVLGGKAKRKKLLSAMGMDVRAMIEVVKGSAFDILQADGGCPASLRPGYWLDLYCGTGSVHVEAISRGCSEVVEYPLRTDMLVTCGCLIKITDRRFGRTHLAIYGSEWAQKRGVRKATLNNSRSLTKSLLSGNA